LGEQAIAIFGPRFPLLAKFIDANAQLSVQVHPKDQYAKENEGGKLGKTEFWYILAAEPGASIVYGFKQDTSSSVVRQAIQEVTLDRLLHEEVVQAGDVVFVPAGTVHAIGSGVLLYELQEYSDVTYRMYDYGRLTTAGNPRELHIERSLDVSDYGATRRAKMTPVVLASNAGYEERCLVACRYFLTRLLQFEQSTAVKGRTDASCVILTSLGAEVEISYGPDFSCSESLRRGQTMVLPAALGDYHIENSSGDGQLLRSYVPTTDDAAWQLWQTANDE
jgi:mannose-6-phosphate isomerase